MLSLVAAAPSGPRQPGCPCSKRRGRRRAHRQVEHRPTFGDDAEVRRAHNDFPSLTSRSAIKADPPPPEAPERVDVPRHRNLSSPS